MSTFGQVRKVLLAWSLSVIIREFDNMAAGQYIEREREQSDDVSTPAPANIEMQSCLVIV